LGDGSGGSGGAKGREKFTAFHRYPPINSVLSPRWRVFAFGRIANIERGETSLLSYFLHD
ncbi:MAG: hypothetical protein WB503_15840, partial [Pseudolabrys sp.]